MASRLHTLIQVPYAESQCHDRFTSIIHNIINDINLLTCILQRDVLKEVMEVLRRSKVFWMFEQHNEHNNAMYAK